jgi:hypothetical protein
MKNCNENNKGTKNNQNQTRNRTENKNQSDKQKQDMNTRNKRPDDTYECKRTSICSEAAPITFFFLI